MAKILLLYPKMNMLGFRFPYSLLPLCGALIQKGHKVHILDSQVEDYRIPDISDFDLIGISTLSGPQIQGSLEMASHFKKAAPNIPIIWGGVHPSLTAMQTIRHPLVDMICKGEGEETLLELVDAIDNKRPFEGIKGLVFKNRKGGVVETPDRPHINLNTVPMLPYNILKLDKYSEFKRKPSIIYMESSRGCPYKCGFCYCVAMHKQRWRAKDYGRTVDEMEWLVKNYTFDEIWFTDDEFAVDADRVKKIAEEILRRQLKVKWVINSRFNYAVRYEKDFLGLLKEAGCFHLSFGGESGSQRILDMIDKHITVDQMRESARRLRDAGISCGVNFMSGFPGETDEDTKKTFDIIDELASIYPTIQVASISIYTPLPGTPLFKTACEYGFKPPASLEGWGAYRYNEVDNLPYLTLKKKRLLRALSLLTRFDVTSRAYRGAGILENRKFMRFVHKTLWRIAGFRWRRKFFAFPIEWNIIDFVLRLIKFGEK